MVQDFLHTDQIAYSSEGELPGGLIMPAGQICYEKETLCTLIKWALFVIYMILLFYVVFFAEGMGRAEIASGYKYNLTLFTEIRRYWRYLGHFDSLGWIAFLNIIGNVLASYHLEYSCRGFPMAELMFLLHLHMDSHCRLQ